MWMLRVLLFLGLLPTFSAENFHPDCADPHNKEISCSVHVVKCDDDQVDLVKEDEVPPEAHDVRVEPFARATSRDRAEHQLHVDISWQMPPNNESFRMRAFELEIAGAGSRNCFLFNVTDFGWTEDAASPRFHFSSDSLFEFSEHYSIWLRSLPRSKSKRPQVFKNATMPKSPDHEDDDRSNVTAWCRSHSDSQASKWTAAFRRIFLHSLAKTIQIEFVGAPPHYCFEAYEVRLMDESGLELLHSHIVEAKDMKTEVIHGKPISFGEFNFTGLQMETDYIPSVIPVERASDGRCLCPIQGESGDPYDSHVVCSCIAADWKKVRLNRIEKPAPPPCFDCISNNTIIDTSAHHRDTTKTLAAVASVFFLGILLILLLYCFLNFYRRHRRRGKAFTLHFKNAPSGQMAAEPAQPLIFSPCTSVLLIYSHDCALHESAVAAFAEVLRDTFNLQVHVDQWDEAEIEENVNTYINASIVRADKIIIINSLGAYMRANSRHRNLEPLERMAPGPFDKIYDMQIDLALQHARVVSVRFPYTTSNYTLYALSPLLQYTIPDNLSLLVSSLTECTLRSDPRMSGFDPHLAKLHAAVSRMQHFIESEPKWFERTHHRIRPLPLSLPIDNRSSETGAISIDRSIDSGIADSADARRNGAAIAATSPVESEAEALLAESQHEVVPEEPSACSSSSPVPGADSAYLSGKLDSVAVSRSDTDTRSDASGSDRPDDPVMNEIALRFADAPPISATPPPGDGVVESAPVQTEAPPLQAPPQIRQGAEKLGEYSHDTQDSGMISDLHSGLLS